MIKQRKLKHKKNFDKGFHRNNHEFAVSRPQKKKQKKKNKKQTNKKKEEEKFKSFLLTSIRDINRKLLEPFLVKSSAFIEAFVRIYS